MVFAATRSVSTETPWIIWVAVVGAVIVAIYGFRAYTERADSTPQRDVGGPDWTP